MRDLIRWLALGIGYVTLWSVVVLVVFGAVAYAWTLLPRPVVLRWRA